MSKENLDVVRAVLDRWQRGDPTALDLLSPDVEYVSDVPLLDGKWHGHDGVIEWFTAFRQEWANYEMRIDRIEDLGDRVLTVEWNRATGKRSGFSVVNRSASIWTVSEGKVTNWRGFRDEREALAAAGLDR